MPILVFLAMLLLALWLGVRHMERTRPQDLPWTPLDLTAPIGWATGWKLQALEDDPSACHDALARAGVAFTPMPERRTGPDCGFVDSIVLERAQLRYTPTPLRLACPLAAALVLWERRVIAPQARTLLGTEPLRVHHYGTYNCRRLYGRGAGPWSAHATAAAIDVAAFDMADGRRISVQRDWGKADAAGAFLHAARDGACRLFGTTLGPDYNPAHHDHFHLDMRGWRACR